MKSQLDSGEGPRADLSSYLVESHPAAGDQLLDGILVIAHVRGELLQWCGLGWGHRLLILRVSDRADGQAVEATVEVPVGHRRMTFAHFCGRTAASAMVLKVTV